MDGFDFQCLRPLSLTVTWSGRHEHRLHVAGSDVGCAARTFRFAHWTTPMYEGRIATRACMFNTTPRGLRMLLWRERGWIKAHLLHTAINSAYVLARARCGDSCSWLGKR